MPSIIELWKQGIMLIRLPHWEKGYWVHLCYLTQGNYKRLQNVAFFNKVKEGLPDNRVDIGLDDRTDWVRYDPNAKA